MLACAAVALAPALSLLPDAALAADLTMRVAGNSSANVRHSDGIEKPFFLGLPKAAGLDMDVKFNPMDVVNVKPDDALRLLRSNIFDVMSVQIGSVARDDPFLKALIWRACPPICQPCARPWRLTARCLTPGCKPNLMPRR
jgi:hypothetical protein